MSLRLRTRGLNSFQLAMRAQSLSNEGKIDEAVKTCKLAIKADNNCADAHRILGGIYEKQGQVAEAIDCLENEVKVNPAPSTHYRLAELYKKKENYREAVEHFGKTFESAPHYKDVDDVLESTCKKILAARGQDSLADYYMGRVLFGRKQYREAAEFFEKSVSQDSPQPEHLTWLARCLYFAEDFEKSVQLYQKAAAVDRKNPQLYKELGNAYERWGKHTKAIDEYSKALQIVPDDAEIPLRIAESLEGLADYDESARMCIKALRTDPEMIEAHLLLAILHDRRGNKKKAVEKLREILRKNPDEKRAADLLQEISTRNAGGPE